MPYVSGELRGCFFRTCRGQVSLPQNTITALEALARTKAARRELVTYDPGLARNLYNDGVVEALRDGRDLPNLDEVESVERRARLQAMRQVALQHAQQRFTDQLEATLSAGDPIVVAHVRPALAAVLDEASALLSKHGAGIVGPAEAIVSSPPDVGEAWTRFGELAEQSSTLRRVHTDLTAATAGTDTAADFAVIRDDPRDNRLWGASYTVRHNVKVLGPKMLHKRLPIPRRRASAAMSVVSIQFRCKPTAHRVRSLLA